MQPESECGLSSSSLLSIIESGLGLAGKRSKDIIISYIEYKYGLTAHSIAKYKAEFENYLQEILGQQSAEIITSRINNLLKEEVGSDGGEGKKENQVSGRDESSCAGSSSSMAYDVTSPASSIVRDGKQQQQQTTVVQQRRNGEMRKNRTRTRLSTKINFIICDKCFWSASFLTSNYELRCMSCGGNILSAVPIANNENFAIKIDSKSGISLFFQ